MTRTKRPRSDEPALPGTRERVIHAARRHFAENGYAGSTIRGIAEEVGVTPMALYNYASSKAELFELVWRDASASSYGGIDTSAFTSASTVDAFEMLMNRTHEWVLQSPEMVRFVVRTSLESQHPDLAGARLNVNAAMDVFERLAEASIARGEIQPNDRGRLIRLISVLQWGIVTLAAFNHPSKVAEAVESAKWAFRLALSRPLPLDGGN